MSYAIIVWYDKEDRPNEHESVLIQDLHGERHIALWCKDVNGWDCGTLGLLDATQVVAWTRLPQYQPLFTKIEFASSEMPPHREFDIGEIMPRRNGEP